MSTVIKILIVEHDLSDLEMMQQELKTSGINYVCEVVKKEQDFINALTDFIPDIILSDYTLPSFAGPTAFKIREELAPHTPFIFVSGTIGEEKSIELIKNGLTDFVLKDKLFTLSTKVARALKDAKDQKEKIKTEQQLKKAYEEKNMVLESIDDGFFAVDKNSLITYWNKKAEILLNAKKEDVIGKDLHKMFTTADSTVFFDNYQKALSENSTVHFEGFSKRSNKWFEVSAFASDNGMSVYFKDITGRRNSEDKLKESELRYRSLIEQATDAICITDASLKFIDINPYGCEILGYTFEEGLQLSLPDVLFAEDLDGNPIKVDELKIGATLRNERRLKRKDGSAVDMEVSTKMMEDGSLIMFGHDITQRKKTETIVKESEIRYRTLFEQNLAGVYQSTKEGVILNCNDAFAKMLKYDSTTELLKRNAAELYFSNETRNDFIETILHQKKLHNYEAVLKCKDSSPVHVIENISLRKNDITGEVFFDGILIDITENRKADEKIKKANRLYTFISQVNQNIVHIKDEAELFRNACQIAFEFGKFKMAWIGLFENSRKNIRLVDQNGISAEDIPLFAYLPCEKDGPQETALKTGIYLCNDPDQCPELQAWRPFAARHGIRSAIVLPIKKAGHIIGTFNLYASELNFFDKEEIALLTDVTEDISFALDLFEKAKKHTETETLILKNETRFRALIEKSGDMEALSTKEGKMIYGSPSITKVLGYSLEEFCGLYSFNMIHPDDIEGFKDKRIGIMDTPGSSFHNQNRFLHKNGSWIWCEGSVTNMLHEPGVNALVSNFRDISEKKITEQLREFDSINLNALINNTTDLMWSVDRDCKLITFNQPFFEIIKFVTGRELAKGDDVYSVVVSVEQFNRFKISYARAFAGETFTEIEHIPSPVDSWSEISYYPIRKGTEIIGTACHSRNITERKKAEEEVLHTLNEKNTILESIGDAFFAVDKTWAVTYWNNHAEEMLGVPKKEIVGYNLWDVFKSSIDSESYWKYHEAIETNKVIQFEDYYPVLNKWYEISAYPSEKGLAVYFKDITERKISDIRLNDLNEDLQQQAKELAISNMELEQFAYVASHDLQEPLRMVTSFLTQLDKKYGGTIDEKGKQYIYFAVDGAKRMRQIILDLLEYSRAGRTADSVENIDLNELIEEIQILFRKQIEEKKAHITIGQFRQLHAHKSPIRQVFQNLIGNALKYAREDKPVKIHINAKTLDDHWQFSISDNGIGIEHEYFEKIFIIFQRLHNKEEFSGTGMGLAITKKIIESQGGKIWVESEEGKGSTFYFTLPKEMAI